MAGKQTQQKSPNQRRPESAETPPTGGETVNRPAVVGGARPNQNPRGGGVADLAVEFAHREDRIRAEYEAQLESASRIIAFLMGRYRNRKITPAQWAAVGGAQVRVEHDADGGKVIRVTIPASQTD